MLTKNKRLLRVASIMGLICIVFAAISLAGCERKQTDMSGEDSQTSRQFAFLQCFHEEDPDKVKKILEDSGIELLYNESTAAFGFAGYQAEGLRLSAYFGTKDNAITGAYLTAESDIRVAQSESIDADTIREAQAALATVMEMCSGLFGVDVSDDYNFYGSDGSPQARDPVDYESWLNGDSQFALFVRDEDGLLWKIYGEMAPIGGLVSDAAENETEPDGSACLVFTFSRLFETELFKDVAADISLEQ